MIKLRNLNAVLIICSAALGLEASICEAGGQWEFGHKTSGPIADENYPFIQGKPPGVCSRMPNELETIRKDILENKPSIPASEDKIAIFTMGAPGCGKSTSIEALLKGLNIDNNKFVFIDPDDVRSRLKNFIDATHITSKLCSGKLRAYADAVSWCISAGREMARIILQEAQNSNKHFIYDSPCANPTFCAKQIIKARNDGYKTYVIAVFASKQDCAARAHARSFLTGRYTDPDFVSSTYEQIRGKFSELAQEAIKPNSKGITGEAFIYDNDVAPGNTPKLIFTMTKETDQCDKAQKACAYFMP